ncbi:MAG TPA: PEGA domain-containing protein [Bryobacteraceae bacterium]|nr:PEGA domain-containing protein [Bryobacteraceae bacterium]
MGDENLNPLEELKRLDQQVGLVASLEGLKPIYYRLDEIAKQYSNDFEVQLVVGDIKQHLVNRGTKLKEQQATIATPSSQPAAPPPMPPPMPQATPPPMPAMTPPPVPPPTNPAAHPTPPPIATPPPMPAASPISPAAPPPPMPSGQFSPPPTFPTSAFPQTGPQAIPPTPPVGPPPITGQTPSSQRPITPPPQKPVAWKKALIFGAILGLLVAVAGIGFLLYRARLRKAVPTAAATMEVQVATTPPGAAVKVNGEDKCTSPCSVPLPAGDYQITAALPGYESGATGVTVAATGAPPQVSLTLEPSPQPMRILAEGVDGGKVTVDDQDAGIVQDGQFVMDNVKPGPHVVKIVGKGAEASFSFETADAKAPNITGTTAKGLLTIVVSSFGNNARVATSAGPLKLALNGQPQADTSPGGVDLQGFQPGAVQLAVGEGPTQKSIQETFTANPTLTVFLRPDKAGPPGMGDLGTLLVVTGEDNVRVFVNNKEQKKQTARGQLRVPTLPGKVQVRVFKDGFNTPPTQTIDVVKGADARVEFQLTKMDTGTVVKPPPPPTPAPVVGAANGTVHVTRSPGAAVITYKRDNEAQTHQLNGNQVDLPPGNYSFTSKAPGFTDRTMPVQVASGGQVAVDLTLASARVAAAPPPKVGGMADWEDPSGWARDGEAWVHHGGNFVPYKPPAKGTYEFTVQLLKGGNVFRGGHIRWYVDYVDPKNYGLFEIDKKTFWAKEVTNGKSKDREKTQHGLENAKTFTIQVDVTPDHVVHRLKNGDTWLTLDSWTETGRIFSDGKFGFYIPGNDEIGITDFKFQPK